MGQLIIGNFESWYSKPRRRAEDQEIDAHRALVLDREEVTIRVLFTDTDGVLQVAVTRTSLNADEVRSRADEFAGACHLAYAALGYRIADIQVSYERRTALRFSPQQPGPGLRQGLGG